MSASLPVVIIGAGPVGLAAAAHARSRGLTPLVLEAGERVGAGMHRWAHVRMFSPWEFNIDARSAELLKAQGWSMPDLAHFPTGRDMVEQYLEPLAATSALRSSIHLDARVVAVTKRYRDRMKNAQRDTAPFVVRYMQRGEEREVLAQAVIDASGTITSPNPLGASGIPALGERAASRHIAYGTPDVLGSDRTRYAGRRTLVVGSGHSAFNVLSDLARLRRDVGSGEVHWAIRRPSLRRVLGGGENDQLKERGRLGLHIAKLIEGGWITVHVDAHLDRIERTANGLVAWSDRVALPVVDEIVGATGFRPDLSMLDELRLDMDAGTQSPSALAPLIDPNLHSCGSVRPHGAIELAHPDANLYVIGMKSYGRAPTFLLLTGYEQARSVVAAIAGDWDAARRVELVLPETGVCNTQFSEDEMPVATSGCCSSAAPAHADDACCVADVEAKIGDETARRCGPEKPAIPAAPASDAATTKHELHQPARRCCGA